MAEAMTQTITITRCGQCKFWQMPDRDGPEFCFHPNGYEKSNPWKTLVNLNGPDHLPPNCPLLQSPVTYRAERKGE